MAIAATIKGRCRRIAGLTIVASRLVRLPFADRIIIGAADTNCPGWLPTNYRYLDVTDRKAFARYWRPNSRKAFLAEHVWEHLYPDEAARANRNCFEFLRPGGRLRLAVPDGLHPDPAYIEAVRPGNEWPEHRVLYDYRSLSADLERVGFRVNLLEYWDENRAFHQEPWSVADGYIGRSKDNDSRNRDGVLRYTSLIVDAIKPV